MKPFQYPIVCVEWVDAKSDTNDWTDNDKIMEWAKKPLRSCFSVGYLIHMDDDHLSLLSCAGRGSSFGTFKIPRTWARNITQLREGESDAPQASVHLRADDRPDTKQS